MARSILPFVIALVISAAVAISAHSRNGNDGWANGKNNGGVFSRIAPADATGRLNTEGVALQDGRSVER
jgi:hypothetical protein